MKTLFIIIFIIALILIYGYVENFRFIVTKYHIRNKKVPKQLDGKKCILISDLHNSCFGTSNQRLIDRIKEINPDFILIAGDSVNGIKNCDTAIAFLKTISKEYKCFAADGNHELQLKLYLKDEYEIYNKTGIINLENDFKDYGDFCRVYGLNIDISYYKRMHQPQFSANYLTRCLGICDDKYYNILVAHNPQYIDYYAKAGYNFIVCGHFHGGFVRLPFIGGLITPQLKLFPKYSGGHYTVEGQDVVVSRGLGSHTLRFRIFNTPELIVCDFETL